MNLLVSPELDRARTHLDGLLSSYKANNNDSDDLNSWRSDDDLGGLGSSAWNPDHVLNTASDSRATLPAAPKTAASNSSKAVLVEIRKKNFKLNGDAASRSIYSLARAWTYGKEPTETPDTTSSAQYPGVKQEAFSDLQSDPQSIIMREVYYLPPPDSNIPPVCRIPSPISQHPAGMSHQYPEEPNPQQSSNIMGSSCGPEYDRVPTTSNNYPLEPNLHQPPEYDPENPLNSLLPRWKAVKQKWRKQAKFADRRYERSLQVISGIHALAQSTQVACSDMDMT